MKQTVIGQDPLRYRRCLKRRICLCAALVLLTLAGNAAAAAARTEENHTLLLTLNILSDIACGFFLVYDIDIRILPGYRLAALMDREKAAVTGTVTHIAPDTVRYMDIDCRQVTVDGRRLFLPAGTLTLNEQEAYHFRVAANIILEAEQ